jgi:hypothetical protein
MKFWNHPTTGTGSNSYYHPTYGTLSANFSNTTYNYAAMPNNVTSTNSAVATLMYHCGVAVNMNYTPTGSGAWVLTNDFAGYHPASAQNAYVSYFGYSQNILGVQRVNFSETSWINQLKAELNLSRPVQYAGWSSSMTSAHTWVVDGYNTSNYFHMNWGWGGSYNGYFSLNSLNPGSYQFNNNQQALINIVPVTNPIQPCNNITSIGGCGSGYAQTYTGGGTGSWFTSSANPCGYTTPGIEKIYSFFAPTTGTYSIQVTAASGYVDYLWKSGSCSSSGWNCIYDINTTGQYGSMSWTAGTTYYILLDDENSTPGTHIFYINCPSIIEGCTGGYQWPSTIFTPTSSWQAVNGIYAGEYSVFNVSNGVPYIWSLCPTDGGSASYDSQLTLRNHSNGNYIAYSDDVCGLDAKITWTATFTGQVRVLVNQYYCQENSTSTILTYKIECSSSTTAGSK